MTDTRERAVPELRADRVFLRGWRADDLAPFAALNADPSVMEHYPALLTREQSDSFVHEARFTPCVEIGWRLAFPHWGRGYATEATRAAVAFGFTEAGLDEIVSFTVPANRRSIAVAVVERLGMNPPWHLLR